MTIKLREEVSKELKEKLERLTDYLLELGSLAVGFSGGVDSAFLISVASAVLGKKAVAVTITDPMFPEREEKEAREFCEAHGIRQIVSAIDPLTIESVRHNSPDRCYHCKRNVFSEVWRIAAENGIEYVAEGSNMDDLGDYRPGLQAVAELKVASPLRHAELYKEEIRALSKAMGLPTWSKPAYACLASRFVYGEEITEEKLRMVDRAEQFLIDRGFLKERVRIHGNLARIEVPAEDIEKISKEPLRTTIWEEFKKIGFMFVSLDLRGYKTGSMNVTI